MTILLPFILLLQFLQPALSSPVTVGIFVPLVAKPDQVANVSQFLTGALPLVKEEPETIQWFGVKYTDFTPPTFAVLDTARTEHGRQAHLNGKVAAALFANADTLFSAPPEITLPNILASKVATKGDNTNTEGLAVGLRVVFTARPDQVQAVRDFLTGAVPLVNAEPQTLIWYALEFPGTNDFAIIDFFADEAGREAHLNGLVAAALFASADTLFTGQPEVVKFDVVAADLK